MVKNRLLSLFGKNRINPITIVSIMMERCGIFLDQKDDFIANFDSVFSGSVKLSDNYLLHKTKLEEKIDNKILGGNYE